MQLRANQLPRHLGEGGFADAYLVSGDEQLLVDEACDAIIDAAKRDGFEERTVFEAAPRAAWDELIRGAANLSLFAAKRLLDIRIPARGLDQSGSAALRRYLESPLPDTLLLCRAIGLEWRQRTSAWYKAMDKAGVVIPVWPVSTRELPRWLNDRCRAAGLQLDRDAIDALAERIEGNLLAAKQEIEKLKLLGSTGPLSRDAVMDAVGDSSHFDTFEMIDAALAGQAARTRKMLANLRAEGVAVFMVMGALVNNLRRARELAQGANPRLARNRRQLVERAVRRLGADRIDALLQDCAVLDLQAKGMLLGDAWESLEDVMLSIAGATRQSLAARTDALQTPRF